MTTFRLGNTFVLRTLLVIAAAFTLGALITVYGATAPHRHHPPETIVGRDTPQLIPDEVAYRLVLNTIAGLAADPKREKALDGYLRYMEQVAVAAAAGAPTFLLTDQDRVKIRDIALDLDTSSRRASAAEFRQVRAARSAAALTRLQSELTPEGRAILLNFVTTVAKRNMKLVRR